MLCGVEELGVLQIETNVKMREDPSHHWSMHFEYCFLEINPILLIFYLD